MPSWLANLGHWLFPPDSEFPSLVPLAIFLCILFFLEALYLFIHNSQNASDKRVRERLKFVQGLETKASGTSLIKSEMLPQESWKQALLLKLNRFFNLDELLLQAAVPWSTSSFLIACIVIGSFAGAYGFFLFGPVGAISGFIIMSYVLPNILLILKKRHRLKKFEKQLPEALGLMSRSLKAGHSLPSSIQLVADEMADPIGIEFFKTFKEYNYGMDFSEVMMNLYKRNQLRDLKFFITAILIQRETGGNLVEILDKISYLIRERFKLMDQIKALTAEGRLSGLILIALPVGLIFIIHRVNPQYIEILWTHPTGRLMAGIGFFFQFVGMIAIKKIVSIKV